MRFSHSLRLGFLLYKVFSWVGVAGFGFEVWGLAIKSGCYSYLLTGLVECDTDKGGSLDKAEFKKFAEVWYTALQQNGTKLPKDKAEFCNKSVPISRDNTRSGYYFWPRFSLFGNIDVNGDGSVSLPELLAYFENLCKDERKQLLLTVLSDPSDEETIRNLWNKYAEGSSELTTRKLFRFRIFEY